MAEWATQRERTNNVFYQKNANEENAKQKTNIFKFRYD